MALAIRNAVILRPEALLGHALSDFESILNNEQRDHLRSYRGKLPGVSAVMILTAEIDRENSQRKSRCVGPRLTSILESVLLFSGIVDTFISGSQSQIGGAVWGGVKVALLAASNFSGYFERLSVLLMDIGRTCPRRNDLASLFPSAIGLQKAVCEYYTVIISLCKQAVVSSRRPFMTQLSLSFMKSFDTDFGKFQNELRKLGVAVREEAFLASQQAQIEETRLQAYERRQSSSYRSLGSVFRQRADQEIEQAREQRKRKQKVQYLDSLSTYDYSVAWKEARKQESSDWLFVEPKFENWLSSPTSSILWCAGTIGSGKTVLAASLVEHLTVRELPKHSLAYFFCRFDHTFSTSLVDSDGGGLTFADDQDIIEHLKRNLSRNHKYYLILDGLDECEKDDFMQLTKYLKEIISSPYHVVKLFCSSRTDYLPPSLSNFEHVLHVSMSSGKANMEIARLIELRLEQCLVEGDLRLGNPTIITDIQDALTQGAQGMFLWVVFQIKDLCEQKSDEDILNSLKNLPKSLPEVYDRVLLRLRKSGNCDTKRFRRIFQWVVTAHRPLSLEELRQAIGIEPCQVDWDPTRLVNNIRDVLACCGGLLTTDEEQLTIHFAHHSIKQHLLAHCTDLDLQIYHIDLREADFMAGETCVTYLNFSTFERQIRRPNKPEFDRVHYPSAILVEALPQSRAAQIAINLLKQRAGPKSPGYRVIENTAARMLQPRQFEDDASRFGFLSYAQSHWLLHTTRLTPNAADIWRLWSRLIDYRTATAEFPWTASEWECFSANVIHWMWRKSHFALFIKKTRISPGLPHLLEAIGNGDLSMYNFLFGGLEVMEKLVTAKDISQQVRDELMIPIAMSGDSRIFRLGLNNGGNEQVAVSRQLRYAYDIQDGLDAATTSLRLKALCNGLELPQSSDGDWTPLMVAAAWGRTGLVELITGNSQVDILPWFCAIREAALRRRKGALFALNGWNALHYAAAIGDIESVKFIIKVDPECVLSKISSGLTAQGIAERMQEYEVSDVLENFRGSMLPHSGIVDSISDPKAKPLRRALSLAHYSSHDRRPLKPDDEPVE
ncbi:hypothetical protein MMC18_006017 [Xylographa bjoerkii]|nr:hypothetical protein [Xylographa bjoerkii]